MDHLGGKVNLYGICLRFVCGYYIIVDQFLELVIILFNQRSKKINLCVKN